MSGLEIPVDILVNVEGSTSSMAQVSGIKTDVISTLLLLDSHPLDAAEDDTFGIFSKQCSSTASSSLGTVYTEKDYAARSSTFPGRPRENFNITNFDPETSNKEGATGFEVLVKLDDSLDAKDQNKCQIIKALDFNTKNIATLDSSVDSPFKLAWDLIEEEARSLADGIKHQSEDNNVELVMNISPDSPLVSPPNSKTHHREVFLVDTTPKQETAKPKASSILKPAMKARANSIPASPAHPTGTRAVASRIQATNQTPSRSTPVRRSSVSVAASPAENLVTSAATGMKQPAKPTMKAPLRPKLSAPAKGTTAPPKAVKGGPIKASHLTQHTGTPRPPAKPLTFLPRGTSTPASEPIISRPPLLRSSSNLTKQGESSFPRQGSLRLPSKRTSFSSNGPSKIPLNSSVGSSDNSSTASEIGPAVKTISKLGTPRTLMSFRTKENKPI